MSSWIVEDKNINRFLNWVYWCEDELSKNYTQGILKRIGFDLKSDASDVITDRKYKKLGKAMVKMNYDAVNYRYDKKTKPRAFKYNDKEDHRDIIQVLKSLECYLYQCSEGDINEQPLFIALRSIEEILKNIIIKEFTDYDKKVWE